MCLEYYNESIGEPKNTNDSNPFTKLYDDRLDMQDQKKLSLIKRFSYT